MKDESVRVIKSTKRERPYRINEVGRAAIEKFLDPDYGFLVIDMGPDDRVQLTVTVTITGGAPGENGSTAVTLELPSKLLEEVL